MDTGSRSHEVAGPLPWRRALAVWMGIILAESVHGMAREIFIAPVIGDLRARQWGVLIGCLIIFLIALATARWVNAAQQRTQLLVGVFWVALTVVFEFTLGLALGSSGSRILSDYNPAQGGFMLLGLLFMACAPWLAAKLR